MGQLDIFSLDGRVAVVTGGGGGIGSALAVAFAQAGAKVAVAGRNAEPLEAVVARITEAGGEGMSVTADVTTEADAEQMVQAVVERFGRIDLLVNAVGGGAGKVLHPAEAYPRDDWDWIMAVSYTHLTLPTKA